MANCSCRNINKAFWDYSTPNSLKVVDATIDELNNRKLKDVYDDILESEDKTQACSLKDLLNRLKDAAFVENNAVEQRVVSTYLTNICKVIDKKTDPNQACADSWAQGDLDKLKKLKQDCRDDGKVFSCSQGKCVKSKQNTKKPDPQKVDIQGCMDPEAINYVKGATTPTQCEYELEVDLINEYIFCNTQKGCINSNNKNTLKRGENKINVKPTMGLTPEAYIKNISDGIFDIVLNYSNGLFPINDIGFYGDKKNDYLYDLSKALTLMVLKNQPQLEDYDNFPYTHVTIYVGAMRIPIGTAKLNINENWGDNLKNVVTDVRLYNDTNNFVRLLKIANNLNKTFDLDILQDEFNKDVNWLNDKLSGSNFMVSNAGVITLLEHKEGLGKVLNEHRRPTGLINILK